MQITAGTEITARALLFDMDGTLIDASAVITRLWRRWAARHGLDAQAILRASHGQRVIETVAAFAPSGTDIAGEAAALAAAAARETVGFTPVPGAAALLHALPRSGWAVVTSAERSLAARWLGHAGLPVPEVMVAAQDVAIGKPHPAGYRLAASNLDVAPADTVVFEDSPAGFAAATAAGARLIALATTLPATALTQHDWLADFTRLSVDTSHPNQIRLRCG